MISEIYNRRILYYKLMQDFLDKKMSAWTFRVQYWEQRHNDLDKNKISGYADYYLNRILFGNNKLFEEKCIRLLNEKGISALKEYEKGAQEFNINGEMFFMGIWNFIDDYVREYYPSDNEGFDPASDVDEKTLTKIIQAAFDVLERNKDRWESKEEIRYNI